MKRIFIICLLSLLFQGYVEAASNHKLQHRKATLPDPISVISVPKSGTHLVGKLFDLVFRELNISRKASGWKEHFFCGYCHTWGRPQFIDNRVRKIFLVRDPKDTIASAYHFIDKHAKDPKSKFLEHSFEVNWLRMNEKQKLNELFYQPSPPFHLMTCMQDMMQLVSSHPEGLVVKFEELVGAEGGGDAKLQKKTIEKILTYAGFDVRQIDIKRVQKSLFGNTDTFHKGKIGKWRDFPEYDIFLSSVVNNYSRFFGYE